MKTRFLIILFALSVLPLRAAEAEELVTHPFGGRSWTSSAGDLLATNNGCRACVMDGDIDTAWRFTGNSLFTIDGQMSARATRTFWKLANVETLSARLVVDGDNSTGSTRINEGSFEFQYRVDGADFVTLVSDSFGPIGGD